MFVGEVLERELGNHFRRAAVRLVVHAHAPLFFDRLALVVDVFLGDRRRPHAVRFEEQRHVELIRRHLLEIDRVILIGLPVVAAAVVFDERRELAIGDVLRSFEHQVLEQMGEAGAPLSLVPRPDVIGHRYRHDRCGAVGRDDDAQPVFQARVAELDFGHRDGGRAGDAGNGDDDCGKKAVASHG